MIFLSPVIGDGTEDNKFRPAAHDVVASDGKGVDAFYQYLPGNTHCIVFVPESPAEGRTKNGHASMLAEIAKVPGVDLLAGSRRLDAIKSTLPAESRMKLEELVGPLTAFTVEDAITEAVQKVEPTFDKSAVVSEPSPEPKLTIVLRGGEEISV